MLKIYALIILVILTFLTVMSFAQDGGFTMEKNKKGIAQMKEAIAKLNDSMTIDEAKEFLGEPTFEAAYGSVYWFAGDERLILRYKFGKISVINKSTFDLLLTRYSARDVDSPVLVDGVEFVTSNPIVMINSKLYLPIEDFAEQLGIGVSWNEEKQQLEIR